MIRDISLQSAHGLQYGRLELPEIPHGLVLVARAHHAPVDAVIAAKLADRGYAILNMELLSAHEAQFPDATQNVPRLAQRLLEILDLIRHDGDMQNLPLVIYANGDSTPAAIRIAAQRDTQVHALACHGGLLDRAGVQALELLACPLLMLFDATDNVGETAYRRAAPHLKTMHESHFLATGEDPLMRVAEWFSHYSTP